MDADTISRRATMPNFLSFSRLPSLNRSNMDSPMRDLPKHLTMHLRGSIRGTVVDHNDLLHAPGGQWRAPHAFQHLTESVEFVVDRNDDGDLHGFRSTAKSDWPKPGGAMASRRDIHGTTHRSKIRIWCSD